MSKHKSKYSRERIKKSASKTDISLPIMKSEKLLCREYKDEQRELLLFKILNDDSSLEMKTDACGDALISLWKQFPEMHTYIRETLYCIISNTIKNNYKWDKDQLK
jgi:hypothetical protein